ncbi:hypothetical protein LCGC14_1988730 [marine sediment metagenome]|uniref:Uncharacterized protein n=1 Tax=marine sediment metagenome TaxID=412755 RepID=A0A0F9HK13_9ZZZZ
MTNKRRYKGFDYGARDPKPEPGMEPDFGAPEIAPPEEEPDADRNPEAGIEVGGEAQGGEGEGEESPRLFDESEGESES